MPIARREVPDFNLQRKDIVMNDKPWRSENGGAQLEAFLGTIGCRTHQMQTVAELLKVASAVFEVAPGRTVTAMARSVDDLGKKERRRLSQKNVPLHWPEPCDLWPSDILARAEKQLGLALF